MQSTPLPAVLDDLSDDQRARLLLDTSLRSLMDVLATVPDPRSRHGRRYELSLLLTCLVAGLLCGCNSLDAVGLWCQEHQHLLRRLFGPRRHLTPTGSLYRRLLPRLSAAHLEWALAGWLFTTRPRYDHEPIALDGKVVCGAHRTGHPAPHLLSVVTHQSGETLLQVPIPDKVSEIRSAQALLPYLLLHGRVVTADALHTQTAFAEAVLDAGGEYLLWVKGNQHLLHADLIDYFADPAAHCQEATTLDRHRGRTEQRCARTSTELNAHLARFPQVGQVIQLTRTVTERGATSTDIAYFITSCTPRQADPARLLTLIRGHWSIERQHWLRDVVFGEDHSHLRTKTAPQILAALRNAALTLLRRTGHTAITAARRSFAAHPARAFALLRRRFRAYR